MAWRALRGALYAVRSLWSPYEERLPTLNDKIAAAMGNTPADVARHRALLDLDPAPDAFWSAVAVLGFLAWAASLLQLATRGFDPESGAFVLRRAAPWLAAFVGTAATWMLALAYA